jgi:hypothetical protein
MHFKILHFNTLFNDAVSCIMSEMNEWVWSIGGMILSDENRGTGRGGGTCPNVHLLITNPS